MKDSILNFNRQFAFEPKILNASRRTSFRKYIVCGMGGSALAADLVRAWNPSLDFIVWRDYGLPPAMKNAELKRHLVIVSSYSGNTEEAVNSFEVARKAKCPVALVTTGGALLARARRFNVPHIVVPDAGIQPRMALGFGFKSILALMRAKKALRDVSQLEHSIRPAAYEHAGKMLAQTLSGKIPIAYASHRNEPLAYVWKVKLNETAKTPAFLNAVPELNHNEMTGFDPVAKSIVQIANRKSRTQISAKRTVMQKLFHVIVLDDPNSDPRHRRRLSILSRLYRARGIGVTNVPIRSKNKDRFFGIFSSVLTADWTAYHLARRYGVEPEEVPIVEEFKELMA